MFLFSAFLYDKIHDSCLYANLSPFELLQDVKKYLPFTLLWIERGINFYIVKIVHSPEYFVSYEERVS